MFAPVYLDHNATTPLDPAVRAAMLPWLEGLCGNASSRHEYGRQARAAVDLARQQVAAAVNAHPSEVIFTSGGSEANNLFLKGLAACRQPGRLAVSAIEHPCVLQPARQLRRWHHHRVSRSQDALGLSQRDHAVQQNPYQFGLPTHTGLGKDRTQVSPGGITANI